MDINVLLIDHMGSDLSVVNAARVSFAMEHTEFDAKNSYLDSRLGRFSTLRTRLCLLKNNILNS